MKEGSGKDSHEKDDEGLTKEGSGEDSHERDSERVVNERLEEGA